MSRQAPGEHRDLDLAVAPFDRQGSLPPSDRALQGLRDSYGLRPLGSPHPTMPSNAKTGVGRSPTLFTTTRGSMVGLASAAGTLRGSGENRFGCPPPQPPANRSYKYGPAWPGFLILTMREGIAREAGWYKHVNDFRRGLLP